MLRPDEPNSRGWRFEACEERLALSAQPVADFWIDYDLFDHSAADFAVTEPSSTFVLPLAVEGHGWTEVAAARTDFGLDGSSEVRIHALYDRRDGAWLQLDYQLEPEDAQAVSLAPSP